MADGPWLTIVGFGEDGAAGLSPASANALAAAEIVTGAARHLAALPPTAAERREWPTPFAEGIAPFLALRGRRVVMLVSGDPFWFGAGTTVTRHLSRGEWIAIPAPSSFSLAAARLGWAIETTVCLGLHAAPFSRLRPHLAPGVRAIVLVRDGAAAGDLAAWLAGVGFGATTLHVMEALGGPHARLRQATANGFDLSDIAHPVAVGLDVAGRGPALARTAGLPDALFEHDGQITRQAVRALTLSALAPRPGELLWDIGAGSGSVAIEWLLAHPRTEAIAFEADAARAARIRANALSLGVDRLRVVEGRVPETLAGLAPPAAVFVGGGLTRTLLDGLWTLLPAGARLVANAVTLETEALLAAARGEHGGRLLRIELAESAPLGSRTAWEPQRPIVQWSAVR